MKFLFVTDAWTPQTNGVVTTLANVLAELAELGHETTVIEPGRFPAMPLPSYPEIRIAATPWRVGRMIEDARPDAVHVVTEGPLGLAARRHLVRRGLPFTTSLHTKFPEYVHERIGVSPAIGYRFLRWFHRPAACTLVTTASHRGELDRWGLTDLVVWGRGVDACRFRPSSTERSSRRPTLLYVGRVAVEKNIAAFLELPVDARKVVVGDGPQRSALESRHPDVEWRGYQYGQALVASYGEADAFVFPSRTDTFGLVMLEALACGTPVAAYPVTGPKDIVEEGVNGALDDDLGTAVQRALAVPRRSCRTFALANSWREVARRFVAAATPASDG